MATALAGTRLTIREPRVREVREGDSFDVVIDLEVPDPWFELPSIGKKLTSVDGRTDPSILAFEVDGHVDVPALVSGESTVRDSRLDVHSPAGFPDGGSGRGVEVILRAGAI